MGAEGIRVSVMRFGMKACNNETLWTGAEGTLHVMNGIRTGAGIFATSGALFVATSLESLGSQKNENSESGFGCGGTRDVVIFDGEATLFISSASGFQKKENSDVTFIQFLSFWIPKKGELGDGFRMWRYWRCSDFRRRCDPK